MINNSALVCFGLMVLRSGLASASATEVCRFAGTTDYAGQVTVTASVASAGDIINVDVTLAFQSTTMLWIPTRYLVEEISNWRAGELVSVAVNTRQLVGGRIIRQQWDDFQRADDGMHASRVQAKTLADFRRRHPRFVQYWDPAMFGRAWLNDYQSASPERRADLDLKTSPVPAGLRSPLAMAFYWIRWLPPDGQHVPLFLPGFKTDPLAHLAITGSRADDTTLWQTPLRHSGLSANPISTASAWTSADRHLLRLAFALHGTQGTAMGQIEQLGCEGAPVRPFQHRP